MTATFTAPTPTIFQARHVVERFIEHIAAQNLDGLVSLYGPYALWEAHVPGWDGSASHPTDLREFHFGFFVRNRDAFTVEDYDLLDGGDRIALRWTLSWRDRQDGAHCISFQSHFFDVTDGRIDRHHMYCAGVRVREG